MAGLRCQGVAKNFGSRAVLTNIDLEIDSGTMTAVLGASGSGKSTLLRLIAGFLQLDDGRILMGDAVLSQAPSVHLPPEARHVGYVAQDGALFPHLNVGENVAFGLPRAERKSSPRIGQMLELVGMDGSYAGRRPHELSGGEQRRISLARALAPQPQLVLLDEPFSDLDMSLRVNTREAVKRALSEAGTTALLVTHDQGEAMSMGNQVAVLLHGVLAQTAPPWDLYHRPCNLEVGQFVGDAVLLPGTVENGVIVCALGKLRPMVGDNLTPGAITVMLRPEQIEIVAAKDTGGSQLAAQAVVLDRVLYGAYATVKLRLQAAENAVLVSARTPGQNLPNIGDRVGLIVNGEVMAYPQ